MTGNTADPSDRADPARRAVDPPGLRAGGYELGQAVALDRRRAVGWGIAGAAVACFVLFTLAVHLRLLDALDEAVRSLSRPEDVWGPLQARAADLVDALDPAHVGLLLLLVLAVLSISRRSWRPFVVAAGVGLPVVAVTTATKWIMQRWDPSIWPVGHGGFPSGHTVSMIMACGLIVVLVRPRTHWGWMLPAILGLLMGSALILASVHPATDVLGAGLLALAALAGAQAAGLGQWAAGSARRT
jgi:membrane-associated phospholipid phosphatase